MNGEIAVPPLEAEALTRFFGPICAVADLSFHVERGETVGLLGPNGAGKTTTLRMLTGSLLPTRGQVRLAGHDLFSEGAAARAHLGYLPEQLSLYGEMSVDAYLGFMAKIKGISGEGSGPALEKVRRRLDLDAVWNRPTRSLSRGYRQRVGLAQALLGEPDLLILDEPTVGLDPNQIRDFRSLVRKLGKQHAILLSTHILPEAMEICDRVMILNKGRLVAMERPDRLMSAASRRGGRVVAQVRLSRRPDVGDPRARVEAGDAGTIWRIEADWDEGESREALQRLLAQGATVIEWRSGAGGLEDVFRRLTLGEEET